MNASPSRQGHRERNGKPATKFRCYRAATRFISPRRLSDTPAGAVLRWRRVDLALFGRIRQHVDAWQLLYRTNSMHHEPEVAVTTVVLPARVRAPAHRPLLAYQCAIDAVADKCFPSYALRYGSRAIGAVPQFSGP